MSNMVLPHGWQALYLIGMKVALDQHNLGITDLAFIKCDCSIPNQAMFQAGGA